MNNAVGPVLRTCDEAEGVIAAIEDDNPGVEISVTDRGAYLRVETEDRMVVTAESLRKYLGAGFEIRSLESMMASFAGRIATSSDQVEWSLGHHESAKERPHV